MTIRLTCSCGHVAIDLAGEPLIATECHCSSCREAGARLAGLPIARPMLEENGGTHFVCYRKDRVKIARGADALRSFRLGPESTTRRIIASCCNSPVFLEFQGGHWLSLYSSLWPAGTAPQPTLRTMTSDRPKDLPPLDDALPSGTLPTMGFYAKLLAAWIGMGFRVPKITIEGDVAA